MTLGFYDHNEGIAYPLQPHDAVEINGTDISTVIVGASFSLSTAAGFDGTQAVTLDSVERIGFEILRFNVSVAGLGLTFAFDVNHPAGNEPPRYAVTRAIVDDGGGAAPELGTASIVINQLGGLLDIAVAASEAVGVDFEEGTVQLIGDAPVSAVRLVNKERVINLTLVDDAIPAGVPTELLPSPLSTTSGIPQVDICATEYDVLNIDTETVEVIVYEEQIVQVDVATFVEDAEEVAITADGAEDFVLTGSVVGWLASGPYDTEVYTIVMTDAGSNEFTAYSDQGDLNTVGTIVFDSPVAVGTKGLTVQWDTSITPLADGMSWQVTAIRGTFDVPTDQIVLVPVVTLVEVPVLSPSSTALTLSYIDIVTSALPPVLTDIVVTNTYEAEDDAARALSGFTDEWTEIAYLTEYFQLQEGYNIDFDVTASTRLLQFNLLPGGGRGLVPADAVVSDCNDVVKQLFGAVPVDGGIAIEGAAGVVVTPEKGAHRITLSIFEPTTSGVESCD